MRTSPITSRLLRGAKVLADFWRAGQRCEAGWDPLCPEGVNADFCKAKLQWVQLAYPREFGSGPFSIIEAMTVAEFEASGLTIEIDHPTHGHIKIGPKGPLSMTELSLMYMDPDAVPATLKIMEAFPSAKVTGMQGNGAV